LDETINIINRSQETLLDASNEVDKDVNIEETIFSRLVTRTQDKII